jgi:hypothetical protein
VDKTMIKYTVSTDDYLYEAWEQSPDIDIRGDQDHRSNKHLQPFPNLLR